MKQKYMYEKITNSKNISYKNRMKINENKLHHFWSILSSLVYFSFSISECNYVFPGEFK